MLMMENKTGEALAQQRFDMLRDIAEELSGDVNFPTSFNAVIRLREVLSDPDWTLDDVAKLLGIEPLISSRLVGWANSAAYRRGQGTVTDIKTAVMRLGINLVRTSALCIATRQFKEAKEMSVFGDIAEQYWQHSLRAASVAYVLARFRVTSINPDEAMLAGLSHDLGAFYLLYRAAHYDELCLRPDSVRYLVAQWHEQIGITLMGALGLPERILEAVRDHDHPAYVAKFPSTLADVVCIANLLADCGFIWNHQDDNDRDSKQLMAELKEQYADLSEAINEHQSEMQVLFS